jgi:hypothetical protein
MGEEEKRVSSIWSRIADPRQPLSFNQLCNFYVEKQIKELEFSISYLFLA